MRILTSLLLAALLSACAGQITEPSYYLLRSDQNMTSRPLKPSQYFSLGAITIAPYIDQRGLLLETHEGDMRPARHHLWAEPLYEGARILLLTEISRVKGQDILPASVDKRATSIDVRIDQLHGTQDGRARLVAYWWLQREGEVQAIYQFAEYRTLSEDGYAALAGAEKALLMNLAGEIAATLVDPD